MTPDGMPKDGHLGDELSAWLDGESEAPERVEAHLAACPECAQRQRELEAIRAGMQGLPKPRFDEAFAGRVTARLGRKAAPKRYWPAVSGTLAAAAVLLIVAAVLFSFREPAIVESGGADVAAGTGMVGEILLGAELEPMDYGFPIPEDAPDAGDDVLVMALANSEWFENAAAAWEEESDLDELVGTLNDSEKTELIRLLRWYEEGAEI